jgi:hypothetical protein
MSNLKIAQDVLVKIRTKLELYGSDNIRNKATLFKMVSPKDQIGIEAPKQSKEEIEYNIKKMNRDIRIKKIKQSQPKRGQTRMTQVISYGDTVLTEQAGNCFEYSSAACSILNAMRPKPVFDVVQMPTIDHAFVVIGGNLTADEGEYLVDMRSWDRDAAICDGWANIACWAKDYPQEWDDRMDEWNRAGLEVPTIQNVKDWGTPTEYKGLVVTDHKQSYTYREPETSWCCCKCYITTATCRSLGLADDCPELTTLRYFRDHVLLPSPGGAREVAAYYAVAPAIVAAIDRHPESGAIYDDLYRRYIQPAVTAVNLGEHD